MALGTLKHISDVVNGLNDKVRSSEHVASRQQ